MTKLVVAYQNTIRKVPRNVLKALETTLQENNYKDVQWIPYDLIRHYVIDFMYFMGKFKSSSK